MGQTGHEPMVELVFKDRFWSQKETGSAKLQQRIRIFPIGSGACSTQQKFGAQFFEKANFSIQIANFQANVLKTCIHTLSSYYNPEL